MEIRQNNIEGVKALFFVAIFKRVWYNISVVYRRQCLILFIRAISSGIAFIFLLKK